MATASLPVISKKIVELNSQIDSSKFYQMNSEDIEAVEDLLKILGDESKYHSTEVRPQQFLILNKLLSWPVESLFPSMNTKN